MKRPLLLSASAAALALVLAACGGTGNGAAGDPDAPAASASTQDRVEIRMFTFSPGSITVKAGTSVTWVNQDEILHTVTAGSGPDDLTGDYDGQLGDAGSTFSFTYGEAGTFEYFCTRHPGVPGMHGTVVVT